MSRVEEIAQRLRRWVGRRLRSFLRGSGPTPEAIRRADFFRTYPVGPDDVVFLGDSITEGAELPELFPNVSARNRGIAEETSADVLGRMDTILPGAPRKLFILVGVNDLLTGVAEDECVANHRAILERCRTESPTTQVFVQSILPGAGEVGGSITRLNRSLQQAAADLGATFISHQEPFAGPDGGMSDDLSPDGVHLWGEGYRRWQSVLAPYVEQ